MKKLFKNLFLVVAFCGATATTQAQTQNSLLWEITGNNIKQPSYLFGTIHMICEEDYVMTPVIENSLKNAKLFFAEIDLSNMGELMVMQKELMAKEPLSKRLSAKKYEELKVLLKETIDADISEFEKLSDVGITSMVMMKMFSCDSPKMYEMELMKQAMEQGKKMGGLETIHQQLEVMKKSMSIDYLYEMLKKMKEENKNSTKKMVELYKKQDLNELERYMYEEGGVKPEQFEDLLTKRNKNWVEQIPELIQENSVFFAVGAGHLGGKNGVIALLKAKGYQVKPINIYGK